MTYEPCEPRPPKNDDDDSGNRLDDPKDFPADEPDDDGVVSRVKRRRIYQDDELRGYPPRPRR